MFAGSVTHATLVDIRALEKLDTLHFFAVIYRPGFVDIDVLLWPFLLKLTGLWWILVLYLSGALILKQLYKGVIGHVFSSVGHILPISLDIVILIFIVIAIERLLLILINGLPMSLRVHILHIGEAGIPKMRHHVLAIFPGTV